MTPPAAKPRPGDRLAGATGTLELLRTASGAGEPTCDGTPMALKAATPPPASD